MTGATSTYYLVVIYFPALQVCRNDEAASWLSALMSLATHSLVISHSSIVAFEYLMPNTDMSPFPAHSTVKAMRVTTKRVWPLYGHPTRR